MNWFLSLTLVVLTIGPVPSELRSQSSKKRPGATLTVQEQKSELAKLREVFASVDRLPAKGARWVEVQAGPAEQKTWYKGWLLRESETEIQLLTQHGWKETFNKKRLAAKRPPAEFTWSDAWAVRYADFAQYCQGFMATKKKQVEDNPNEIGVFRFQRERAAADAAVVDSARLASWASATGNDELARQLLKRAEDKLRERRSTYIGLPASNKVYQFVADQTFPHVQVNTSTLLGEPDHDPRKARLHSLEWKRALAKIPYRSDHDEILQGIKQLEILIAEDKAWKEPTKEEFAKLDVKQRAAYWLHHLRDLNVTQSSSPGMCMVLTDSPWSLMQSQNLAKEGAPGDCCQQVFEAIALHSIYERTTTSGYPLRDGRGKQCKERAERWWREFQKKGEKQMLIEATMRGAATAT
jgi:hypothetical protein